MNSIIMDNLIMVSIINKSIIHKKAKEVMIQKEKTERKRRKNQQVMMKMMKADSKSYSAQSPWAWSSTQKITQMTRSLIIRKTKMDA